MPCAPVQRMNACACACVCGLHACMQEAGSDWIAVMWSTVHAITARNTRAFFAILQLAPYVFACNLQSFIVGMRRQVLAEWSAALSGAPRMHACMRLQGKACVPCTSRGC